MCFLLSAQASASRSTSVCSSALFAPVDTESSPEVADWLPTWQGVLDSGCEGGPVGIAAERDTAAVSGGCLFLSPRSGSVG